MYYNKNTSTLNWKTKKIKSLSACQKIPESHCSKCLK